MLRHVPKGLGNACGFFLPFVECNIQRVFVYVRPEHLHVWLNTTDSLWGNVLLLYKADSVPLSAGVCVI